MLLNWKPDQMFYIQSWYVLFTVFLILQTENFKLLIA